MRIAFVWLGISGRYGHNWEDGLYAALKVIEKRENVVGYFDIHDIPAIHSFSPDVVLLWEAACTYAGPDGEAYKAIQRLPYKKALLFAGGPIRKEYFAGFDLTFVESAINEKELADLFVPWKRAFGVNTQIFKPEAQPMTFDGALQATFASWKRQWLVAEAFHQRAVLCGRYQETDTLPYNRSKEAGALIFPELSASGVNTLISASWAVVNSAEYWGGGQRATLEAMAAGIPVIVMTDSPKNREFVEASGAGLVVDPDINKIREALEMIKAWTPEERARGVGYVQAHWTETHYADAILEGIAFFI